MNNTHPAPPPPDNIQVGDWVEMRKPHPCGGRVWTVYRVGADVGIRCTTCGHRVLLARSTFYRRLKRRLASDDDDAL